MALQGDGSYHVSSVSAWVSCGQCYVRLFCTGLVFLLVWSSVEGSHAVLTLFVTHHSLTWPGVASASAMDRSPLSAGCLVIVPPLQLEVFLPMVSSVASASLVLLSGRVDLSLVVLHALRPLATKLMCWSFLGSPRC